MSITDCWMYISASGSNKYFLEFCFVLLFFWVNILK